MSVSQMWMWSDLKLACLVQNHFVSLCLPSEMEICSTIMSGRENLWEGCCLVPYIPGGTGRWEWCLFWRSRWCAQSLLDVCAGVCRAAVTCLSFTAQSLRYGAKAISLGCFVAVTVYRRATVILCSFVCLFGVGFTALFWDLFLVYL